VLAADRAELLDPAARERFGHEARSAARFTHPDAVAMYDAGEADGALYIVMELVVGRSLAERLATEGPLPVGAAVAVAGHVLDALAAAHAAGIVHRDVKPANVLLGDDGTVKLADFGIAKRLDELGPELTGTGRFVGTPRYLAPEQVSGGPATPATDVYAVGVVLFEMLAGSPPFDGGTPLATALAHRDDAAPDVRSIRPEVPAALAAVVTTAMAKRPEDRYPTAAAMRAALATPAAEPTERMPAPPARPRSRWLAAALVAVALAAVVAVIAVVFGGDDDPLGLPATSSAPAATTPAAPTTVVPMTPATTTPRHDDTRDDGPDERPGRGPADRRGRADRPVGGRSGRGRSGRAPVAQRPASRRRRRRGSAGRARHHAARAPRRLGRQGAARPRRRRRRPEGADTARRRRRGR
jgi:serine/threonine-protein kinase